MLLAIDGFDYYTNLYYNWNWVTDTANITISTATYRPGSSLPAGSLKINNGIANIWAGRNLYSTTDTASVIIIGFAVYIPSTTIAYQILKIGTGLVSFTGSTALGWNPSATGRAVGGFDIYDITNSTWKNATPAVSLTAGTWYYVELKWATGTCTIWVDGTSYAGPIVAGSTSAATTVFFGTNTVLPTAMYIDDLYIMDNIGTVNIAQVGNCRVSTGLPASNSITQWTPKSGNNYANVNQSPDDGDATYVTANAPSTMDTYRLGPVGVSPSTVYGIKLNTIGRKTAGTTRQVRAIMIDQGVQEVSPQHALTENYGNISYLLETRPYDRTRPQDKQYWVNLAASAIGEIMTSTYGFELRT